jgi:hypothetical protein
MCETETQTDFSILLNFRKSLSEFELKLSKIDTEIDFRRNLSQYN